MKMKVKAWDAVGRVTHQVERQVRDLAEALVWLNCQANVVGVKLAVVELRGVKHWKKFEDGEKYMPPLWFRRNVHKILV